MIRRYLGALCIAAAVTFGLFFLMQYMIARGSPELEEIEGGQVIDFVRVDRDERVREKERDLPDRPPPPAQPPPPPPLNLAKNRRPDAGAGGIGMPALDPSLAMAGGPSAAMTASEDADAIPLVRIAPQYPPRAQSLGLEGWVELEFTISKSGSVKDVRTVDADPPSIFNRAAERAVSRWKYKPRFVDGEPIERSGVRVVISFQLER